MDLSPWDYWEAAGTRPKNRTAELVDAHWLFEAGVDVFMSLFCLVVRPSPAVICVRGVVLVDVQRADGRSTAQVGPRLWKRVVRDAVELLRGQNPVAVDHQVVRRVA